MARIFEPMAMVEPRWQLGKSGNQVVSATTETKITWETEINPAIGCTVSLANNRVTVDETASYFIGVTGAITPVGDHVEWRVFKNGSQIDLFTTWCEIQKSLGFGYEFALTAGDYIEVYVYMTPNGFTLEAAETASENGDFTFFGYKVA